MNRKPFFELLYEQEPYLTCFLDLIPDYCCDDGGQLVGPSHQWVPTLLSYSLYFGLGVGFNDYHLAKGLMKTIVNEGMSQTCELTLSGFRPLRDMYDTKKNPGALWNHAVSYLTTLMSLMSPETSGKNVEEELVRSRTPYVGFIPGLTLVTENSVFAETLYKDAVNERKECDEGELIGRINFMKNMVNNALIRRLMPEARGYAFADKGDYEN